MIESCIGCAPGGQGAQLDLRQTDGEGLCEGQLGNEIIGPWDAGAIPVASR